MVLSAVYGPADGRPDFAAPIYAAGANSNPPPEGAPPLFIAVAAVSGDYSVVSLLQRRIWIRNASFVRPLVVLEKPPDRIWNWQLICRHCVCLMRAMWNSARLRRRTPSNRSGKPSLLRRSNAI